MNRNLVKEDNRNTMQVNDKSRHTHWEENATEKEENHNAREPKVDISYQ